MTNYTRGRAKEYRVAKRLRAQGWTVLRTAGSHGPFDLIAIKEPTLSQFDQATVFPGYIMLIQVKGGKSAKREQIKALKEIKHFSGTYLVKVEAL
jgi:predicted RNA binding protein YcfA (HicA-like mRNA interferase family)